jgi:hypothetical protein
MVELVVITNACPFVILHLPIITIPIPAAIAYIGEDVDGYGSVLRGNEGIDGDGAWGRGGHYTKTYGATVGDAGRREEGG